MASDLISTTSKKWVLMLRTYLRGVSLKAKMALAVASIFTIFVIAASYLTLSYFERTFKASIFAQQFTLVSTLAENIDAKLQIAQNALLAVAATVPPDTLDDADEAQRFIDKISGFHTIFDNNISFISTEGRLIAETRYQPGRRGKDLSYREFIKRTVATRQPCISEPYISTHAPQHPAITMTAPIFDRHGNLAGMLMGSIDLLGKNLLADMSTTRIGQSGYLFMSDNRRVLIVYPDKKRIMKLAVPPGANKLYDRAVEGLEGSGETVNSSGVPVISSYKRVQMTSWLLGASYPRSEAYAPLYQAERYFRIVTVVSSAMLLFFTWLVMKRLLMPLLAMTRHVKLLPENPDGEHHVLIDSADEIGTLATAFNTMIDTLDRQRDRLKDQKSSIEEERAFLQAMMDAIPDLLFYKDLDSVYRKCNASFASLVAGRSKEAVLGCCDYDFAATAEHAELLQQNDQTTVSSGTADRYEYWIQPADGRPILLETIKVPFRDASGRVKGVIGIARDISEHKRTEEILHEQAMLLEQEVAERQKAQEALTAKRQELEKLNGLLEKMNGELEERIDSAVTDLRHKDRILTLQSRQAAMGEMINHIAHQWRQPLNGVGLIAQNLMSDFEMGLIDRVQMKADIDKTLELVDYMSQTIDDFRTYLMPDKTKTEFCANVVVDKAVSIVEPSFKNMQIAVKIDAEDAPVIFGHSNEYCQVLLNILINARDALSERKIDRPEVMIAIRTENGKSVVTISDNAGGIPDHAMANIFDPFFSTKGPDKGTGVGLFMSKNIIESSMNGRLTARNNGHGAEFMMVV
jgi:PAS domain S-box-containing protein